MSSIKTSCQFCEFRKGLECELNLIGDIAREVHQTEDGEPYNIIDKFCMYRRPHGWKEAMKEKVASGLTYKEIARSELKLDVTMLVFIGKNVKEHELHSTVKRINNMTVKPKHVIFMNHSKVSPLFFFDAGCQFKWSCEQLYFNVSDKTIKLRHDAENLCAKKVETTYFITIDHDKHFDKDYIQKIENLLIDEEQSFICVSDDRRKPGEITLYQTKVFKFIHGHINAHATDKIKILARKQKCQKLHRKTKEIFA